MNQPLFLHIVERLEGFLGKLPEKLQKPILHELTPLKELFLKQREPRLVLTGSHKFPVQEVFAALFANAYPDEMHNVLVEVFRWQNIAVGNSGTIALLDARGADDEALKQIESELRNEPADAFLHVIDGSSARPILSRETETLASLWSLNRVNAAKVVGISLLPESEKKTPHGDEHSRSERAETKLQTVLSSHPQIGEHFVEVIEIPLTKSAATSAPGSRAFDLHARARTAE